jgi:hypothetical protein
MIASKRLTRISAPNSRRQRRGESGQRARDSSRCVGGIGGFVATTVRSHQFEGYSSGPARSRLGAMPGTVQEAILTQAGCLPGGRPEGPLVPDARLMRFSGPMRGVRMIPNAPLQVRAPSRYVLSDRRRGGLPGVTRTGRAGIGHPNRRPAGGVTEPRRRIAGDEVAVGTARRGRRLDAAVLDHPRADCSSAHGPG